MPELEALWFGGARADSYDELGQYLERRMAAGLLRPMPDSEVAARIVTETVSWFGWHRHEGRDSALYKDETVKRTVIEFIEWLWIGPAAAKVTQVSVEVIELPSEQLPREFRTA